MTISQINIFDFLTTKVRLYFFYLRSSLAFYPECSLAVKFSKQNGNKNSKTNTVNK
ncbi:hypothetical protein JN11_03187 [Mucilaginibacter frigoritolerans]|uniref:Uncharacterized protein n=1 Tax=Mucilaginibacter frigoritolerans TaxID=652788 RepID=A0A562TXV1_9SPHI|nr:hypothetical protein JN11_03187 [Mucilaginibacter frigoritolerans]